jgi:hypothetical protein
MTEDRPSDVTLSARARPSDARPIDATLSARARSSDATLSARPSNAPL